MIVLPGTGTVSRGAVTVVPTAATLVQIQDTSLGQGCLRSIQA